MDVDLSGLGSCSAEDPWWDLLDVMNDASSTIDVEKLVTDIAAASRGGGAGMTVKSQRAMRETSTDNPGINTLTQIEANRCTAKSKTLKDMDPIAVDTAQAPPAAWSTTPTSPSGSGDANSPPQPSSRVLKSPCGRITGMHFRRKNRVVNTPISPIESYVCAIADSARSTPSPNGIRPGGQLDMSTVSMGATIVSIKKQRVENMAAAGAISSKTPGMIIFQNFNYYPAANQVNYEYRKDLDASFSPITDCMWIIDIKNLDPERDVVYIPKVSEMKAGKPPKFLQTTKTPSGELYLDEVRLGGDGDWLQELKQKLDSADGCAYRFLTGSKDGCGPGWYLHELISFPPPSDQTAAQMTQVDQKISANVSSKVVNPSDQTKSLLAQLPYRNLQESEQGMLLDTVSGKWVQGMVTGMRYFKDGTPAAWYVELQDGDAQTGIKLLEIEYAPHMRRFIYISRQDFKNQILIQNNVAGWAPKGWFLSLGDLGS